MKIRPRLFVKTAVLFATVLLVMVVCTVNSAADSSKNKNIEYIDNHFSIIYTTAWKSLPKDQRIAQLELSSEFLKELTDVELVYAVIHYPFTGDMVVHEDLREGYEYVLSYSEVLKEYDRRDGKQTMLNEYYNSELCTTEEKANYMYQWIFDALLSLNTMKDAEQNNLRLEGEYGTYTVHTVTTPNGTSVTVWKYDNDFTTAYKASVNAYWDNLYPNATRLRSATPYYNCHSYAWYSTATSNRYWMNYPTAYMSDGSYTHITSNILVNDKLYYSSASHSGIATYVGNSGFGNLRVISKWGAAGLYNHWYNDCPYSTTSLSNWR